MLQDPVVISVALAYLGLLFAVAYYADKRADAGRSVIANPYIYSLSLAVYATTWTFFGSVGRAVSTGVGFLPIYVGPTLTCVLWWWVLRKIIRISKVHRITSLADFMASRYGKNALVAGVVTVIAVIGILPYISLQLKAISTAFEIIHTHELQLAADARGGGSALGDSALYVALILAAFTILFGTRHLDASERHEGMVAAIAFESLVKLVAFLAVGAFVTFGLFDGFGDVFERASALPEVRRLLVIGSEPGGAIAQWASLASAGFAAMLAILFLPRQFQVAVVENVDENHVKTAMWLFPLYMLVINLFVPPIAFGGLLHFAGAGIDPDTFVLTLPLSAGHRALTLLVFIGGLSAATGMVIVETIALSTMVCNDLVMPLLLRWRALRLGERRDLGRLLLAIRRAAIVLMLLLGYLYFRVAGEAYALVSIGLISFAAVAQFAPPFLGGLFWKGGTAAGALAGLGAGFVVWLYTLLLPAFARSGWLPATLIEQGPFGIELLRPLALFGAAGLDQYTHSLLWSMLANAGAYIGVSLASTQGAVEHSQATLFVDVFKHSAAGTGSLLWRGGVPVQELRALLARFLGPERAAEALEGYARSRNVTSWDVEADADLVQFAETKLAGAIGGASAHAMVASVVKQAPLTMDEVMIVLDEASQVIRYSRELEQKSRELEAAYAELRSANERLTELDRMKDDFVSHVSHELRTPLTSIRSFSEILHDNPKLDEATRSRYLTIVIQEAERLTRLINQVLDLAKLESGRAEWTMGEVDPREVVRHAVEATSQLFASGNVALEVELPDEAPPVLADRDRLIQVVINLIANAVKFCDERAGRVRIALGLVPGGGVRVDVQDNGPGIAPRDQDLIFEKFRQVGDTLTDKPRGTGLGLPISREIIRHFAGRLWVESEPGKGATFSFVLPAAQRTQRAV
jgi:Na+/proline symporter/nitrogen-specific signal transduction histidine kinase